METYHLRDASRAQVSGGFVLCSAVAVVLLVFTELLCPWRVYYAGNCGVFLQLQFVFVFVAYRCSPVHRFAFDSVLVLLLDWCIPFRSIVQLCYVVCGPHSVVCMS